jgi:uncharacterized protein (DUF433 family)
MASRAQSHTGMEEQATEVAVLGPRPLSALIKRDPAVIETILTRSLNGERLADIAKDYGVTKQSLQAQIIRYSPDEWKDTQAAKSMVAYEEARDRLDEPLELTDLARVREQVRSRQWELERLIPRLYGNKQEVTVTHRSDLAERIQAAERRVVTIEGEVVPPSSSEPPGG